MKSTSYTVIFKPFTKRHFIKSFEKKYRGIWDITLGVITEEFERIDLLFLKNTAKTIVDSKEIKICKTEFKIAGTKESRHSSGNRCIIAIHKNTCTVNVLVVYHKNDLAGNDETTSWKNLVKENYPDYSNIP